MNIFRRSSNTRIQYDGPKLLIGSAEKLYPNRKPNIPELKLNYSRRLQHCLGLGMTGSGKTESVLLNFAGQDIKNGYGVIIFDGKGDYEVFNKIHHLAQHHGQKNIYFFAANENKDISETYNPFLSDAEAGRKTEMLMRAFFEFNPIMHTEGADYYKGQARAALNMAISVLESLRHTTGKPYNFKDLYYLLTEPNLLKKLSGEIELPVHVFSQVTGFLNDGKKSRDTNISGLLEKLTMLIEDPHINAYNPTLNISKIMNPDSGPVPILFVSLSGTEKERTLGKIILQDIQNTIQARQTSREKISRSFPLNFLYLDEFSSYVYDGFLLILNKARSANVAITILTQSYGDLARLGDSFAQSILDNTGAKIILKQDSIENKQVAQLLGETLETKFSETWAHDRIGRRITEDYDYICRPEEIKGLLSGEGICSLPLQDGIGIYKTKFFWHQSLQNAENLLYTPRKNPQTEGLNLEHEVKLFYKGI